MKQPFLLFLALCLFSLFLFPSAQPINDQQDFKETVINDSLDILQAVKALQDSMPKPSAEFRPGHVKPLNIENYLQEKKNGFEIQLPKRSLTPSPSIYQGLLLVSGGFGSEEFYAFDAQTGAVKWGIKLDDDGPTSAVVEEDIAVFNTESCTIFAVNVETGDPLWSHFLGDPLMGTPSISDGIVFTAYPARPTFQYGNNMPQHAINAMPQNIEQQVQKAPSNLPNASGDFQIAQIAQRATHIMIALELKTGKVLWQKWIDGDVMSAPVIEGDEVYATTFPGTLYKFHAKTGEILAATASRATSAPVIVGSEIYMSQRSDDGKGAVRENLSALNRKLNVVSKSYERNAPYLDQEVQSRSELKSQAIQYDAGNGFTAGAPANSGWQAASMNIGQSNVSSLQAFQGSRVLHHGGKNYATMGDELLCTHPQSGEVYWKQNLKGNLEKEGGFLATPPLIVDDKIIVASLEGDIILFNAHNGKEWKRFQTKEKIRFQPVIEDGRIYVSTVSGKVICFDTGKQNLTGWPTWGANAAHTNKIN